MGLKGSLCGFHVLHYMLVSFLGNAEEGKTCHEIKQIGRHGYPPLQLSEEEEIPAADNCKTKCLFDAAAEGEASYQITPDGVTDYKD